MIFASGNRKTIALVLSGAAIFLVFICTVITHKSNNISYISPLDPDPLILTSEELLCHSDQVTSSLSQFSSWEVNQNKRNVFFLETSCKSYQKGKIFITARQACAVESTARLNPDMEVYLLYASPGEIKDENTESDRFLRLLNSYPNIKIRHFDIARYIKGTPVESLWTSGQIRSSKYAVEHSSDILRLLTLWKFGGIYMDLDVLVIKSLASLPVNFAGAEFDNSLGSAVLGFDRDGFGHEMVQRCLEALRDNYDGQQWASNGPYLITKMLEKLCPDRNITETIRSGTCLVFSILPPSAFCLVPYPSWRHLVNSEDFDNIRSSVEKESYLIHAWNKLSSKTSIPKDAKNVPYLHFASMHCPHIVQELDKYF